MQKKKAVVAPTAPSSTTTGPKSKFAEFRRQMKLHKKAAAAGENGINATDAVNASPQRTGYRSPAKHSPARELPTSGILSIVCTVKWQYCMCLHAA